MSDANSISKLASTYTGSTHDRADQHFTCQESQEWFIEPNNLVQRWKNLGTQPTLFTLAETHFGCGSNFLHSADIWQDCAPTAARLHYIAAHPEPLTRIELRLAIARQVALSGESIALSGELLANYPATVKGVHTLLLMAGKVKLTLLFGDPGELFEQLAFNTPPGHKPERMPSVNAWFMPFAGLHDGGLSSAAAALSKNASSFAALSPRIETAQQLALCGFSVNRECRDEKSGNFLLTGEYHARSEPQQIESEVSALYWHIDKRSHETVPLRKATILGAGIAGCTVAWALAQRGYQVTVVDRHAAPGSEGSGNTQAIVYPKLSLREEPLPRINLAAMLFASRYYKRFWRAGLGAQCGVLVLPTSAKIAAYQRDIGSRLTPGENWLRFVQGHQLAAVSGVQLAAECGLFFPQLGWLPPVDICQKLLQHPGIQLVQGEVERLDRCNKQNRWSLIDTNQNSVSDAPIVVLASAFGCRQFEQTKFLPVAKVRGQISHLPVNVDSQKMRTVICARGYLTPPNEGLHSCGATYNPDLDCGRIRQRDHRANISQLHDSDVKLGNLFTNTALDDVCGRANFRCTTQDYLPIVGSVPDVYRMTDDFADLRRDARSRLTAMGSYLPNLYVHCGLGSRGLGYAPLTAELLACAITDELPPLERSLRLAMHPARFLIRDLKKHRR